MTLRIASILLLVLPLLCGCSAIDRHPLPEALAREARVPGFEGIRSFASDFEATFGENIRLSFLDERREDFEVAPGQRVYPVLSLSSGGSDGAFGAGLLAGWSETGERPIFKIVTGVSTGALIAPFAFLGRDQDEILREVYTEVTRDDIAESKNPLAIFYSDSIASNEPLAALVRRYVDADLLERIAVEHRHGRRLYVGTTNLDLQRLVVWDLGAIATSGHEDALELFRNVLLASAAIPVVFPPIYLEVEAGGEIYDEIHVDGSVRSLMFLPQILTRRLSEIGVAQGRFELYVVRNGQLDWTFEAVEPSITAIAGRTILTLLQSMAREELETLFLLTREGDVGLKITAIPSDYVRLNRDEFDRDEMRRLYALGRELGRSGRAWRATPPGIDPDCLEN